VASLACHLTEATSKWGAFPYKICQMRNICNYCTKTINSLGGVTVTMPNKILVSLTGPGTCDTPKKIFVNVTKYTWKKNSPKIAENSIIFEPKNHFVWPLEDA